MIIAGLLFGLLALVLTEDAWDTVTYATVGGMLLLLLGQVLLWLRQGVDTTKTALEEEQSEEAKTADRIRVEELEEEKDELELEIDILKRQLEPPEGQ